MARTYIKKLPLKSGKDQKVWVEELGNPDRIKWWQRYVQPEIAKLDQPDKNWNWKKLYSRRLLFPAKEPRFFALCMKGDEQEIVLSLCYCLCVEQFPVDLEKESLFVWYISRAPKQAIGKFTELQKIPGLLGQGSLDATLVKSLAKGHNGRVWLHADGKGGKDLLNTYISWGMTKIPKTTSIYRFGVECNDGRYLFFDEHQAESAMSEFDIYRGA
ncbi:MAG: hypothetical protein MI743_21480 [Sneathiellales bacterium]|nr:hypothetical protein [Sneathiellales bacterium]